MYFKKNYMINLIGCMYFLQYIFVYDLVNEKINLMVEIKYYIKHVIVLCYLYEISKQRYNRNIINLCYCVSGQ